MDPGLGRAEFGRIRQQPFQHQPDCRSIGASQRLLFNGFEDNHPIGTRIAPAKFRDGGLSRLAQINFFEIHREPLGFQFGYHHYIAENGKRALSGAADILRERDIVALRDRAEGLLRYEVTESYYCIQRG